MTKLAHTINSVYQALIWIRPGYEASSDPMTVDTNRSFMVQGKFLHR